MIASSFFVVTCIAAAVPKPPHDSVTAAFAALESPDRTLRHTARSTLERISRSSSWKASAPFLSMGTEYVRQMACKSIRNSKDPGYLQTFLKRIQKEKSASVGWCLANGIGEVARQSDVPAISAAWRKTRMPQNRMRLLQTLGRIDSCGTACADTIGSLRKRLDGEFLWDARLHEAMARKKSGFVTPDSIDAWYKIRPEFAEFIDSASIWTSLGDHRANPASRAKLFSILSTRTIVKTFHCRDWSPSFPTWVDLLGQTSPLRLPVDLCSDVQKASIRKTLLAPSGQFLVDGAWTMDLGGLWGASGKDQVYGYCLNRFSKNASGERHGFEAAEALRAYLETAKPDAAWIRERIGRHAPYTGLWLALKIALCARPGSDTTDSDICKSS